MQPFPFVNNFSAAGRPGFDEVTFRKWYQDWAKRTGLSPDPDDPAHGYDYRAAFQEGREPELDVEGNEWHWPSQFKAEDNPRRFLAGDQDNSPVWSGSGPKFDTVTEEWSGKEGTMGSQEQAAPEAPAPPPASGLLDRVADRMSDMGYGGGEEARRNALRRALGAMGARMAAGATKEGFGALAPAVGAGLESYQGGLVEQRDRRDQEAKLAQQAEQERVQGEYTQALTEQLRGKPGAAEAERRRLLQERAALIASRREALAGLGDPELEKRLGPLVGSEKFDDYFFEATGKETPKPPEGFTLGEGQVRYDAQGNVIARGPAKTFAPDRGGDRVDPWGDGKLITRGNESILVYPDGSKRQIHVFAGGGADPMPQIRQMAQSLFNARVERGDGPKKQDPVMGEVLDSEATYRLAFDTATKLYREQMVAMRQFSQPNPSPSSGNNTPAPSQALHARNLAVSGLLKGGKPEDALRRLKALGVLDGYTPEQILEEAKAQARKRGWKG